MAETSVSANNRLVAYRGSGNRRDKVEREKPRMSAFGVAPQSQSSPSARDDDTGNETRPWTAKRGAMPYVSDAQRRWAHTDTGTKALGGRGKVSEWDQASKGKKLPERVKKRADGGPVEPYVDTRPTEPAGGWKPPDQRIDPSKGPDNPDGPWGNKRVRPFGPTGRESIDASGKVRGMAKGGKTSKGGPYMVGEKGPELFVPESKGNIVPNNKLRAEAKRENESVSKEQAEKRIAHKMRRGAISAKAHDKHLASKFGGLDQQPIDASTR